MPIDHIKPKINYYKDLKGEWRWSLIAKNGKVLAEAGEGYKRRRNCISGSVATRDSLNEMFGGVYRAPRRVSALVVPPRKRFLGLF